MKKPKKIVCPYCGSIAVLRDGEYVYSGRAKGEKLYVCSMYPECNAYVGVHKGTNIPLGTLANSELRNKRIRAHKLFDSIWKNKLMSKKEAYRWMEYSMGLIKSDAHIAKFSDYRCEELMKKCKEFLSNNHISVA